MKAMITGRAKGKTTQAIKWAAKHDAYIVCATMREAGRISNLAKEMGLTIPFPITFYDMLAGDFGPGCRAFVFDNVDMLLAQMSKGAKVVGFTATAEAKR